MRKKRCFGNSDNKLVWIPPQILAQYPEKRKICKIRNGFIVNYNYQMMIKKTK